MTRKNKKSKNPKGSKLNRPIRLSKRNVVIFAVFFALIGSYAIFRALAAVSPAGTYTDAIWPNPPSGGYSSTQFNLNIGSITPDAPYFWSHQFGYINGDGGYFGLQSHGIRRADGSIGKLAIFSVWQATNAQGPACGAFSGEGTGMSCSIAYDWVLNHDYKLSLLRSGSDANGTWWKATVTDNSTGIISLIGSIQTPPSWSGLSYWSSLWTEYFGPTLNTCDDLPYSKASFSQIRRDSLTPSYYNNHISTSSTCTNSQIIQNSDGVTQVMGNPPLETPAPPPPAVQPPTPRTLIFSPIADASVKSAAPTSNYGSRPDLSVCGSGVDGCKSNLQKSYIKFNVADLKSAPTNAKLRVYVRKGSVFGGNLYLTSSSWQENSITYSNAPAAGNLVGGLGMVSKNSWAEFDLGKNITGNGTYSFVLSSLNTDLVSYSSRETTNKPVLVITP